MDFDPGFHEEMGDDGFEEGYDAADDDMEHQEEQVEFDSMGNPIYIAAGVGLGYHLAQDEREEREIAEDILKRKDQERDGVLKVPLASRHTVEGYMTPFARWAAKANKNPKAKEEEIEYTLEEKLKIIRAQY